MKKIFFVLLFAGYFTTSCTNESVIPRPYPRVNTIKVESVDVAGATFSGEVFYSSVPIRDHGFLWSPYAGVIPGHSDKVSLGPMEGTGRFEAVANWGLEAGKTYYMKAYAISDDHEVYGDVETFVAKGSAAPIITDIFPNYATWGDTLNIVGQNFSILPITNQVTIHNVTVDIISGNENAIKVRIPYYLAVEFSNVAITMLGQTSTSSKKLQLKAPEIQSILPASGSAGQTVTITGIYFSGGTAMVYFNGVNAPLVDVKENSVVVKVPAGLPSGNVEVKLVTGDGNLFDTVTFKVI